MPARVIGGDAAWRGPEIADSTDWKIELGAGHQAELLEALRLVATTPRPLREITAADFPLPTVGPLLADAMDAVVDGRGFVLLRGVPIEGLNADETALMYWGIG